MSILYEPASTRGDFGVLVLTENEPCKLPFYFEIPIIDATGAESGYIIKPSDKIIVTIKKKINDFTPVIEQTYTNILNNTAIVYFSIADMKLMPGGNYVLSATLNQNGTNIRTLISELPVRVEEVAS